MIDQPISFGQYGPLTRIQPRVLAVNLTVADRSILDDLRLGVQLGKFFRSRNYLQFLYPVTRTQRIKPSFADLPSRGDFRRERH